MKGYDEMPGSTREKLENEFRNLLLIIPFRKRLELEKIVRAECFAILQDKIAQFDEHWSVYDAPSEIDESEPF
jgi:hypothetical protein